MKDIIYRRIHKIQNTENSSLVCINGDVYYKGWAMVRVAPELPAEYISAYVLVCITLNTVGCRLFIPIFIRLLIEDVSPNGCLGGRLLGLVSRLST